MVRMRMIHVCQQCGHKSSKWLGKCPGCGEFNSFVEEAEQPPASARQIAASQERPVPITEVQPADRPRLTIGMSELDRVFGGGIVHGSVSLIGGDPGIGKSTLILQMCERVAAQGHRVLYVSSEESIMQTKLRADRLGVRSSNLYIVSETNVDAIRRYLEELKPSLAIVDSIQMIYKGEIPSAPGSVGQVRECAAELTYIAKRHSVSLLIVGHVTKDGTIAGPRTLEHLVDAVFYFEGDRFQAFRVLRGAKNRFGSTNEIGIFEMLSSGLREVLNPSELFMSQDRAGRQGSAIVPSVVGSRTLLVEMQALTTRTAFGLPTRKVTGFDLSRVAILIAVLERRCGLSLGSQDVFVNAVGGVQIEEPAADLAVAVAMASSFRAKAVDEKTFVMGEVGLSGEVRGVAQAAFRVAEGQRLGFKRAVVPRENVKGLDPLRECEVIAVGNLHEALEAAGVL